MEIQEDNAKVPENKVTFMVGKDGEQKSFECVRAVISHESEAFETMLFEYEADKSVIHLPEDDPDCFQIMNEYTRTGKVTLHGIEQAIKVYFLMDKYLIDNGKRECISFMLQNVNHKNCCVLLEFAINENEKSLEYKCWIHIKSNFEHSAYKSDFPNCGKSILLSIVRQNDLNIESELTVYKACVQWAKRECVLQKQTPTGQVLRHILGDFLPYIRFLTMSQQEMVEIVCEDGILTCREQLKILKALKSSSPTRSDVFCNSTEKRVHSAKFSIPFFNCNRSNFMLLERQKEVFVRSRFSTENFNIFVFLGISVCVKVYSSSVSAILTIRNVTRDTKILDCVTVVMYENNPDIMIETPFFLEKGDIYEVTLVITNGGNIGYCHSNYTLDSNFNNHLPPESEPDTPGHFRNIYALIID